MFDQNNKPSFITKDMKQLASGWVGLFNILTLMFGLGVALGTFAGGVVGSYKLILYLIGKLM